MARPERQIASDDRLADTLGAATEQLRATLEREAADVIRRAQAQAASIEEAARQTAAEVEREAHERAREANARAEELRAEADAESARAEEARAWHSNRISRLLADVDAMEERMQAMVGDLRRRLNGELEDLGGPSPDPDARLVADTEPPPGPDQAMTFLRPVPLSVATEVDAAADATERNPVLDDMMRAQIMSMFESGASRADAERFLRRFKLGESYLGMLDEIYSGHDETGTALVDRTRRRRFRRRGT